MTPKGLVFIPAVLISDPRLAEQQHFLHTVAVGLLSPTSDDGGTEDNPELGYMKKWPGLPEFARSIGMRPESERRERLRKAFRRLEELGYVAVRFYELGFLPSAGTDDADHRYHAELQFHIQPGQPSCHSLRAQGKDALDVWKAFRKGRWKLGA